jgi:hypothetical protein
MLQRPAEPPAMIDAIRPRRPWWVLLAGILSLPFVAVPLAGGAYIAWSLVADDWYRDMFGGYGMKLFAIYVFYAIGIVAIAAVAAPRFAGFARPTRVVLCALGIAGLVAAIALEAEFWDDAEGVIPHGLSFIPYVLWALVIVVAARRSARSAG